MNSWYDLSAVSSFAPVREAPLVDPLVSELAAGDPNALSVAYRTHHESVRAFARRLLGDEQAAEDLVQETFVALPSATRGFRGDCSLRSFVISVTVNRARHFVRAAARRRRAHERLQREPRPCTESPDAEMVRAELAAALFRALDELPLEQRVAFVLCEIEERASHEAAEIVAAPAPTVRARVQAAKRKLRASLIRQGFE